MIPWKELKKLAKKDFSVSAATSASEFRKSSSTARMMPVDVLGPRRRGSRSCRRRGGRRCDSIASSRYLRLNQKTIGLPLAAGIMPTIWKVRFTGKMRPAERDLLADPPAELPHRLLADERGVADLPEALERDRVDLVVGPDLRRPSPGRCAKFGKRFFGSS